MLIFDLIIFAIVLSSVVIVHEFGHFFFAKKAGVKVEEFGIGFPPKIWKKVKNGTEYFIGVIPFGGLNKIYGMDGFDDEKDKDPQSYESKGPIAKSLICLGGVFMNLIFAFVLFYILIIYSSFHMSQNMILSDYSFPFGKQENYTYITKVYDDTPAQESGINIKDAIVSLNGEKILNVEEFDKKINENVGQDIVLGVMDIKTKQTKDVNVSLSGDGEKILGVAFGQVSLIDYSDDKLFCGIAHSINILDYSFNVLGNLISYSFKNKTAEPLSYSMTGPVGIYAVTKVMAQDGLFQVVNLIAILSLALALSNLLPLPALDGAKFLFIILATVNRKVFSKKLEIAIETFGMYFLIGLAIVIIFKDFIQFKDIIFK
ncbi:MAG: site-2 protease family protein [Candidatus Pacebacteria bacterium]|nr:site-2 protease family protein [Candidatus Paceibacterota bacterium]